MFAQSGAPGSESTSVTLNFGLSESVLIDDLSDRMITITPLKLPLNNRHPENHTYKIVAHPRILRTIRNLITCDCMHVHERIRTAKLPY